MSNKLAYLIFCDNDIESVITDRPEEGVKKYVKRLQSMTRGHMYTYKPVVSVLLPNPKKSKTR